MRALLLEAIDEAAHAELAEQSTTTLAPTPDAELDDRELVDVDAIITRGRGPVTSGLIERCNWSTTLPCRLARVLESPLFPGLLTKSWN